MAKKRRRGERGKGPSPRNCLGNRARDLARKAGYKGPWPPAGPPKTYLRDWGFIGRAGWKGEDGWKDEANVKWQKKQEAYDDANVPYRLRSSDSLGYDPNQKEEWEEGEEDEGDGEDAEDDADEEVDEDADEPGSDGEGWSKKKKHKANNVLEKATLEKQKKKITSN